VAQCVSSCLCARACVRVLTCDVLQLELESVQPRFEIDERTHQPIALADEHDVDMKWVIAELMIKVCAVCAIVIECCVVRRIVSSRVRSRNSLARSRCCAFTPHRRLVLIVPSFCSYVDGCLQMRRSRSKRCWPRAALRSISPPIRRSLRRSMLL
jgi:hypothetical protein